MKCPVCGAAELVRDTRDEAYNYKGQSTVIADVTADYCPACGEGVTDAEESARVMAAMTAFNREVNATYVEPGFIKAVREKLGLKTREAVEIFGGGPNGFTRYESGQARPPVALIKLLKLLDRHPELLDEVRAA
jgi:HTH-type transcriptional regulator/antitoxin MqsA